MCMSHLIHHRSKSFWAGGLRRTGGEQVYGKKLEVAELDAVREHMLLRLEQMRQSGVELYVDGREVLPAEAVSKAVRENSPYMADYVLDEAGVIEQVRFDKVTRC